MRKWLSISLIILFCMGTVGAWLYLESRKDASMPLGPSNKEGLVEVISSSHLQDNYDVIVVGAEPEGISAALSSARNGLKTLLVEGNNRDRLGGSMTLGWFHSINRARMPDKSVKKSPAILNKGIFLEWYNQIEGDFFDVISAANVFYKMIRNESNLDLLMKVKFVVPLVGKGKDAKPKVEGIKVVKEHGEEVDISSLTVIDATQDGDIMVQAGVPYTYGREDLGDRNSNMPVTMVFKLKHVTPEVWRQIQDRLNKEDNPDTGADEVRAWGYGNFNDYQPINQGHVKMRGLVLNRQKNDTILIDGIRLFGIDGSDPKKREEAFQMAEREVPHVLKYMKEQYPELESVELDGTAPELYVHETRHMQGEYRLSILDILENRDQWDRVAFGSDPAVIQHAEDSDRVMCSPHQYSIPFRSLVPIQMNGLLVAGRTASYHSLAFESAWSTPVGMAQGQSAGAAAKIAKEQNMTFSEMSSSKEMMEKLHGLLKSQGLDLEPFEYPSSPFMKHRQYEGLKAAVSLGLAAGGYSNEFQLDESSSPLRMAKLIKGADFLQKEGWRQDPMTALQNIEKPEESALTLDQASYIITQALGLPTTPDHARTELEKTGLLSKETEDTIQNKGKLTVGDMYMLLKDLKNIMIQGITNSGLDFPRN